MPVRFAPVLIATLAAGSLLGACDSDDGRTLRPLGADQTTTSVTQPPALEVFSMWSTAFEDGGEIPKRHTCAGNVSPDLTWASTPAAVELALVVRDLDADGYVHWVLTGIDPAVQAIAAGSIPDGATAGANSTGTNGWFGPCPPENTGVHRYEFSLHALSEPSALDPDLSALDAAAAVESASIGRAVLIGTVQS